MRSRRSDHPIIVLLTVLILVFLGMPSLGGCGYDESPIPQAEAAANWEDPDVAKTSRSLKTPGDATPHQHVSRYDRERARQYIERYAEEPNRGFAYCANRNRAIRADCTNFASQVLWYGGVRLQWSNSEYVGWWYRGGCDRRGSSKSWRQVNDLLYFLIVESDVGEVLHNPRELEIGDLIFYRLRREKEGYTCPPRGWYNHTAVVSDFDARGQPLVSYHSNDVFNSSWAAQGRTPGDLGDACSVVLVHIRD